MPQTHTKTILVGGLACTLLLAPLMLSSCAGPKEGKQTEPRSLSADPDRSAAENLQRLASREQQATDLQPIDASIPPGIEPEALAPRSRGDERAHLSLEAALRKLIATHHPEVEDDAAGNGGDDPSAEENETERAVDDEDESAAAQALRHYTRGRQAMLDERYYVAISELQRASQYDPESPRIRRELARAYLAMNNQSRAMEQYAALRQIDPGDAEAVFSLGLNAANRREFETAAAIIGRRFLNDEPFDHDPAAELIARYTIAFSLRHLGYDRAFTELWTLEATEPQMTGDVFERTIYAGRLGSIYRQRAELWRSIGDAHCRRGEYRRALEAYAISAALPAPDPAALHPRVIYANLRLGRIYSAQYELLTAIQSGEGSISDREIRLCTYLADVTTTAGRRRTDRDAWPVRLLGEYVRARYAASPDDAALARAAAALLPPDDARQLLSEFAERRPRDLDVVASLLAWVGARDLNATIMLTVDLVEANPDLAGAYVDRLMYSVPNPVNVLEELDALLPSPKNDFDLETNRPAAGPAVDANDLALAHVKARVTASLGATGEAWWLADAYRPEAIGLTAGDDGEAALDERWHRNALAFALFRTQLVTRLEEPSLLELIISEIKPETAGEMFNRPEAWIARSQLWRSFQRFDEAMDAAEYAVRVAERRGETDRGTGATAALVAALREQARTYVAYAGSLDLESARAAWAEEAVLIAERIVGEIDSKATDDDWRLSAADIDAAFEIILRTFGPGGILSDAPQFHDAARRLFERNPDSRLYVRMMAEEALSQGRYDLALERTMNLYDAHPHEVEIIELAMMAWSRMEQPNGLLTARQWLSDRLARRPGDPALLEMWVQVGLRLDRAEEVVRALTDALDEQPRHVAARRLLETAYRTVGRTDLAFSLGERRLLNRPRGVRREVELAALYGGAGMERQALNRLQWVIAHIDDAGNEHLLTAIAILGRIDPTDSRYNAMAITMIKELTFERAARVPLQVYGMALRSLARENRIDDPLFRELTQHAAEHAQGSGDSFENAVQWRNLAQAMLEADLPEAAAEAVRGRVESPVPLEHDALAFLTNIAIVADAAAHAGAEQAERSIAFLKRLAERNRLPVMFGMDSPATLPDALYQASLTYSIVGDMPGSKRVLEALVEIEPDNAMALNNLGYLRIEAGHDDARTKQCIELAISLKPEDSHILDTVGWLRYKQGRFDDDGDKLGALSLIEASLEQATEPSAEVHDHLGDVLWRLNRPADAVEAWRMAERILADQARRSQIIENYRLIQRRAWGLSVADPEEMYDRDYGPKLRNVREKLSAVEAGETPPIAPTFAEQRN